MGIIEKFYGRMLDSALQSKGINPSKFDEYLRHAAKQKDAVGNRVGEGELDEERGVVVPQTKLSMNQKYTLYERHDLTGGIINLIRDALVSIQPEVRAINYRYDDYKEPTDLAKRHVQVITKFLEDPNSSAEGFQSIRKQAIVDLKVAGFAVLHKNPVVSNDGEPVKINGHSKIGELWNLPAKYMRKAPRDTAGNLPDTRAYVELDPSTLQPAHNFSKDEVIWMEANPLSHRLYGPSDIDILAEAIIDTVALEDWNRAFVNNNAMPEGILTIEGGSKSLIQRATEFMNRQFGGATRRGRIMLTDRKSDWKPLNRSQTDIQFMEYLKWLLQKYMIVFHLQPFVLGMMTDASSKSSAQYQVQAFKDYALRPILDMESFYYTQGIVKHGHGFSDVSISFNKIDKVDAITQANIDRMDVQQGIIKRNEIRAERGLPPVPWGDDPTLFLPGAANAGRKPGEGEDGPREPKKPDDSKDYDIKLPNDIVDRLVNLQREFNKHLTFFKEHS